jgi:hypothetical protein
MGEAGGELSSQKYVWNGEVLTVPMVPGTTTVGHLVRWLSTAIPNQELGLFTENGLQMDADWPLPGGDEVLTLRPVYLH